MSEIEHGHALAFLKKNNLDVTHLPLPSGRARGLKFIGKVFGYDYILGVLLDTEKRHRSVGGNALRAAVLGGNDGLVSNFSLVMGIAGATSGQSEVLLTGLAGLMAGALSMALGEWISMKSSQELFAIGAIIPVIPFFFLSGLNTILVSAAFSALGLFVIGSAITLFTGKSIWFSGFRQVFFGLAAAAVTYGIGSLIGVSMDA